MMTRLDSDWICLTEVAFPCIVGLSAWERELPQTLAVEVALNLNLDAAAGGDLSRSINYAATLAQVEFLAREGRWCLLESLAAALMRLLLAPPARAEARASAAQAVVRLRKPQVFAGKAVPSIELSRAQSWLQLTQRAPARGVLVEVLQEASEAGAYRVQLDANATWSCSEQTACLPIAGEFERCGAVVTAKAAATLIAVTTSSAVQVASASWSGGAVLRQALPI
jgi:FolB domain-containing protein